MCALASESVRECALCEFALSLCSVLSVSVLLRISERVLSVSVIMMSVHSVLKVCSRWVVSESACSPSVQCFLSKCVLSVSSGVFSTH